MVEIAEISQQGGLLNIVSSNLNNDFEHECFAVAVRRLSAQLLQPMQGDIGPRVFSVPGIPTGRFLPHQIWGIWFLVDRVIGNFPPVAMLADDMGLGKTFTVLAALLHLKWLSSEAASGRKFACLDGLSVNELEEAPPFFGEWKEKFDRPCLVMVPPNLMVQWEVAIRGLIQGTQSTLTNLNANILLTADELNTEPGFPERGRAIHLISYQTFRSRSINTLADCLWSIGVFDESHTVRSATTLTYRAIVNADVRCKFQLTGTPMYHDVQSWIVQAD